MILKLKLDQDWMRSMSDNFIRKWHQVSSRNLDSCPLSGSRITIEKYKPISLTLTSGKNSKCIFIVDNFMNPNSTLTLTVRKKFKVSKLEFKFNKSLNIFVNSQHMVDH